MNSFDLRLTCSLLSTAALMIVFGMPSVRAETVESSSLDSQYEWQDVSTSAESLKLPSTEVESTLATDTAPVLSITDEATLTSLSASTLTPTSATVISAEEIVEATATPIDETAFRVTISELNLTTDTGKTLPDTTTQNLAQETVPPAEPFDIDTTDIDPGRATRSGSSYIGVGGNIGLGDGDTALGETSFAVFSKIGLTSNISVRPSVLIEDEPTILIPVTLDFVPAVTDVTADLTEDTGFRIAPYIGAGIAISTGDDSSVDFLATGGVDLPLNEQITATASLSASLFDNPAVGLLLGVGYNFR
ncbi:MULTISPECIES: hypothetical protein [unclassified Coleofasciculus]|uniref:hypothetical protein n=1 Tax=unclassified Coleofasciculus TaxID=2692782 RepID=UPI00188176B8|nr:MULTISPECIES: hypothetical protein [unclassified Coleofasciculus]MBE9127131.1 hypothetical protein [Coleofasciculus sp. LEGE 07081]MBE9149762.1 hypothetical protein [Coleofasciculus sp. LEGE 07092]